MHLLIRRIMLLLLLVLGAHAGHTQPALAMQTKLDTAIARAFRAGAVNRDSGLVVLRNVEQQCEQAGYRYGQASALMACGTLYVMSEESAAPAFPYFREASPIIEEAAQKNESIRSKWYTCMGAAFAKTGDLDSAMYYYIRSLNANLARKKTDYKALLQNYFNIEIIYFEQEQFDKVILYANKTIAVAKEQHFIPELFNAHLILAGAYMEQKKYDTAEVHIIKAEALGLKANPVQQKLIYEIKGVNFLQKKMPGKAISLFKASLAINNAGSPTSLKGLGNAYRMLHQDMLAEKYLLQARDEEQQIRKNSSFLIEICNDLAGFYESRGKYKEAYENRSLAAKLDRERSDKYRNGRINQLESQYRSAEQQRQIADKQVSLLSAENNLRRKNLWIGIIASIALFLAVIVLLLYQKQKAQSHRAASLLQQQEIDKLKAVINAEEKERSRIGRELHDDIMGQLSIIKMNMESLPALLPVLNGSEDYKNIKDLVEHAGRDIRQTAHNLIPDALLSEGLVQAILYFCTNVQRRTGIIINFQHYGYETPMESGIEISLYRIAQELLQNVIKHARASNVLIQLSQREDMLTLTVEDDGTGVNADLRTMEGMGLKSIHARLKAMNGSIDMHRRQPRGTSVTVEINT